MKTFSDHVTQYINAAINIIFMGYPVRTSLGLLFGLVLKILSKIFNLALKNINYLDFNLDYFEFVILGIAFFHIKTAFEYITNRFALSENEEKAFELIRRAKVQGKISEFVAQEMYLNLCTKILENTTLKSSTRAEIENIAKF